MVTIQYLSDETEAIFSAYVESHRDSTLYHTLDWRDVLLNTYKYNPVYLIAIEGDNIKGILPLFLTVDIFRRKKLISLPFSHSVPFLFDSNETAVKLLSYVEQMVNEVNISYIQIKNAIANKGWRDDSSYFLSTLNLGKNIEQIWNGIKTSTRRNIRKAKKNDIIIKTSHQLTDLFIFYELMLETRKRQGSPPYPKTFFRNIYNFLDKSKYRIYLAYKKNLPIASIIMFYHGLKANYAYGASLKDRELLRSRPNELLFWTAIQDAHDMGMRYFDFGISPIEHDGLLRFKSNWGSETDQMVYSYFLNGNISIPRIQRSGPIFNIASKTFKKMPLPIFKSVGPVLLKWLA